MNPRLWSDPQRALGQRAVTRAYVEQHAAVRIVRVEEVELSVDRHVAEVLAGFGVDPKPERAVQ